MRDTDQHDFADSHPTPDPAIDGEMVVCGGSYMPYRDYLALLAPDAAQEELGAELLADDEDFPDFAPWDSSPEAYAEAQRAYAGWLAATGRE